jgi:hypothetical protein
MRSPPTSQANSNEEKYDQMIETKDMDDPFDNKCHLVFLDPLELPAQPRTLNLTSNLMMMRMAKTSTTSPRHRQIPSI